MGNEASVQPGDYREPVLPPGVMEVRVSVYKLQVTGVGFLDNLGASLAGAYHSGVVVDGKEWSFGCHDEIGISGVYAVAPESNPDYTFYQRLVVGQVTSSKEEVASTIKSLSSSLEWEGPAYDLVEHNCNHFTSELCWLLLRKRPPDWINNTANNFARSRRQERAQLELLQDAMENYEMLHGSSAAGPRHSLEDPLPAPGAKAFESSFKSTFDLVYVGIWESSLPSIEAVPEGEDPEEAKAKAETRAIQAAGDAAEKAATAVASAARMATTARARQQAVGLEAWDRVWQRESGVILKEWQQAAVAGTLSLDDESKRNAQVQAALAKADAAATECQLAVAEVAPAAPPDRPGSFV